MIITFRRHLQIKILIYCILNVGLSKLGAVAINEKLTHI